jgi:hypothetical protein
LDWVGLGWIGLGCVGLGWVELGRVGLGCAVNCTAEHKAWHYAHQHEHKV